MLEAKKFNKEEMYVYMQNLCQTLRFRNNYVSDEIVIDIIKNVFVDLYGKIVDDYERDKKK